MAQLNLITQEDVLEALRLWHGGEINQWPLAHLKFHLYLEDKGMTSPALAHDLPAEQNRLILNRGLHVLKTRAPEAEDLLRERFEHRRDVLALANRLNVSESSLYYRQRQAVQQLTEILIQLEEKVGQEWQEKNTLKALPTVLP